jgi:hypothetical protein
VLYIVSVAIDITSPLFENLDYYFFTSSTAIFLAIAIPAF